MVCEPAVEKLVVNTYVPLDCKVSAVAVPVSTVTFTVPVGVPEVAATEIVNVSVAPTFGELLDAVMVVVVGISVVVVVLAGQAVARLFRSPSRDR